ncbi:MAG: gamma subclass chorismate mutase AroQ [Proteobacteria bacterium]|nr:gamma subclass chorismate mutase AroQ [Pseudomonadota bacterium]
MRWPIVAPIEFLSVITRRSLLFGLFWVLITAFPASVTAAVDAPLNPLVTLMIQRLQLSREVAWNKCRAGIPVADPAREARMLTDLRSAGVQEGLSAAEVTRLFLPQIAASRRYQQELIAGWRSGIDIPRIEPLDLAAEIRPRLDKVNREMLRQWVKICREPLDWADKEEARRMLLERGIPSDVAKIAVGPLGGPGPGSR